jgi:hypothetical protein
VTTFRIKQSKEHPAPKTYKKIYIDFYLRSTKNVGGKITDVEEGYVAQGKKPSKIAIMQDTRWSRMHLEKDQVRS